MQIKEETENIDSKKDFLILEHSKDFLCFHIRRFAPSLHKIMELKGLLEWQWEASIKSMVTTHHTPALYQCHSATLCPILQMSPFPASHVA